MADLRRRNPRDQGAEWFVDTTCIDCDVARLLAPGLIEADERGLSYFARPPATPEEARTAWRAALACPTASIGAPRGAKAPDGVFPFEVAPGALHLGHNSSDSFGASAWLVPRPDGNLMVDAPRWTSRVADAIEARGGLARILLTHRDDVADYGKYAARFGAEVWIHEDDADAAPDADVRFAEARDVQRGVRALPLPGHTRGSACFLVDERLLFTGDSLYWSRELDTLLAFRGATWYSWGVLADSLERLAREATFEWVLPGHGGWGRAPPDDMRARLLDLVARMREGSVPNVW